MSQGAFRGVFTIPSTHFCEDGAVDWGDLRRVVDFCAGAGGKTLALAAEMAGSGRLIALDTDPRRLAE